MKALRVSALSTVALKAAALRVMKAVDYDFYITLGVAALLAALKTPARKKLRTVSLKVFTSIRAAYPGDKAFQ